jgi:hypothetical protein
MNFVSEGQTFPLCSGNRVIRRENCMMPPPHCSVHCSLLHSLTWQGMGVLVGALVGEAVGYLVGTLVLGARISSTTHLLTLLPALSVHLYRTEAICTFSMSSRLRSRGNLPTEAQYGVPLQWGLRCTLVVNDL